MAQEANAEEKSYATGVLSALFTLIGLLMAFTFGMAGDQYDTRRQLIIEEANAIGTTYLRAQMLPQPQRSEIRRLLREYVEVRHFAEDYKEQITRSQQLQRSIWLQVAELTKKKDSPIVAMFVLSLNDMIDEDSRRTNVTFWNRVPAIVIAMLGILSLLGMLLLGYRLGLGGPRRWLPTTLLVFTYAMVFLLIVDLNRAKQGLFQVSQQPLLDLKASMNKAPR